MGSNPTQAQGFLLFMTGFTLTAAGFSIGGNLLLVVGGVVVMCAGALMMRRRRGMRG